MENLSNNNYSVNTEIKPSQEGKLIIFSILAIVLSIISIVLSYRVGKNNSNIPALSWNIVQATNGEIAVFLEGPTASKVTGADLNIFIDTNRISILSAEAGGFFSKPIAVRMDNKNLLYSLIQNPGDKTGNDINKPIIKFHLSSQKLTDNNFYILPGSQVYLRDVGGVYPKTAQTILK